MVSCIKLVWRDHDVYRVVYGLMYGIGMKRPCCCIQRVVPGLMYETGHTWDHRPLCIYNIMVFSHQFQTIEHSVYTTSWSLLTNSIHETIDHSLYIKHHGLFTPIPDHRPLCLYNIMVSSHQFHTWDHRPLSVYTTSWTFLTNSIHETRDNSIFLYNTMVSSHQVHTWDQDVVYTEWSMVSCMELAWRDHVVV
jgi:hypothetical protein